MQVYAATHAASRPGTKTPRAATPAGQSLLLTESARSLGGAPSLFEALSLSERETVLKHGRRTVFYRGQTLFNQGAKHDGIYLIETGRIRVFYTAPSGREITLAYWHPGNSVGGPEVFGGGVHQWSGVATSNSSVVQLPGKELRALVVLMVRFAIGVIEVVLFSAESFMALE